MKLRMFLVAGLATAWIFSTFAGPVFAAGKTDWQKQIMSSVASKQVYPRSALSRQLEGRARVKVSVDRSGTITGFEMVEATGHDILDREVEKLMARVNPLPAPPSDVADKDLTFILPLSWALN